MTVSSAADGRTWDREILLVAHPDREDGVSTAARVAELARQGGIGLRVLTDDPGDAEFDPVTGIDARALSSPGYEVKAVAPGPEAAAGCEMVLVLGGDGTFLRAADLAHLAGVPVLGINLGHIGFLAEAEADHLSDALGQVVRREYELEDRMTIDVTVRLDDQPIDSGWALNEVSVEDESHLGVLDVVLEVDGRPVEAFGCDGVLVSTPTGSTAYAFSAGGPVMWPELEAILVVPNNAHAIFARPLVTSPDSRVAVETQRGGHDAFVYCDGRRTLHLPAGGRVEVVRGAEPLQWVRLDSAPFADRLVRKFDLPVTGWRGREHGDAH